MSDSPDRPDTPAASSDGESHAPRQRWTPPHLTEYGSIAKLTQSQGSTLVEFGRPNSRPCL